MQIKVIFKRTVLHLDSLETEAQGNSEMIYGNFFVLLEFHI